MKQILLLTHGDLGKGFLSALKVIAAEHEQIYTISMHEQDSMQTIHGAIDSFIKQINPFDNAVILTDLPVGSTTKIAMPWITERPNTYLICGLNLSLLLGVVLDPLEGDVAAKLREITIQSKETVLFLNDYMKEGEEE